MNATTSSVDRRARSQRNRRCLADPHQETQRIQKTLEDAGIKLGSVASHVMGVSGRAMLLALIAGERDPEVLAELAKGRFRNKIPDLQRALRGRFGDHHALLLGMSLDHIDHLGATMARLDDQSMRVRVQHQRRRHPF